MENAEEKIPRVELYENTISAEIEKWIKQINQSKEKSIKVYVDEKYPLCDIGFLKDLTNVEEIRLQNERTVDTSFINEMPNLLEISGEPCEMNFYVKNSNLQSLHPTWKPNFGISKNCVALKEFSIRKCKDFCRLWSDLAELNNLEYLCISGGNMQNCLDFKKTKKLSCLSLYLLPKLQSLDGIESLSNTLTKLMINTGKKITDYSILGKLKNLEELVISNHSIIKNLDFLDGLTNLKSLKIVETKIVKTKSNLQKLLKLPETILYHTGIDKEFEKLIN